MVLEKSGEGSKSRVEQGTGHRWDPSDSSLRLICLFSGAIALCIQFAGAMEGFPWGTNPGRGAGRQAAGLRSGSDGVDQAWDLDQPEEGKKPRECCDESPIQRPGPPHLTVALEQTPKTLSLTKMGC